MKGQHWADIYEWLHNNVPNHNAVFCRFFPPRRHRQTKSRKYHRNLCTVLQADYRNNRYTPLFRRWVRACPKAINICPDRCAVRQGGEQGFFHAVRVSGDERICHGQDLRCGALIFHHQDRPRTGKDLIEVQQIPDVCSAPGIDRLVGITHDEEIVVIAAQHLHQRVLRLVDVLKFVDHDVFEPLLPLEPDVLVLLENIERELDEVVVVEAEALFLLIEIAVEDDVPRRVGALVLFAQRVERHRDHVLIILRLLKELSDLDHVPRGGIGHVAQCEAALFVDDAEHRVDVGIIQHQKALRVLHRMAVLLQNGDTEAVERVDIARVVVAGQGVDTLAYLVG